MLPHGAKRYVNGNKGRAVPLTLASIGIVIIGLAPTNALPVFLAALIAFAIPRGPGIGVQQQAQPQEE